MRRKFQIIYPSDHLQAGKVYHPPKDSMVIMNSSGIFFLLSEVNGVYIFGPTLKPLSDVIPKYDVVWIGGDDL